MDDGEMKSQRYKMFKFFTREFNISEQGDDAIAPGETDDVGAAQMMSLDQLRGFLMEYQEMQDESCAQSESERIVNQASQLRGIGLTVDEFFQYLFDEDLNGPINTEVHHNMTAPLQQYFIFTGHNSYLTGNQLTSEGSDVPIIKALQRGVREIELDIWPNSTKDDILVLHGRTLTTPVSLVKCLTSIKEYAFEKSPYPVIINLEDHLTPDLQAKVAEMVTEIFGDMLYYTDENNFEELPSPEQLKHRVLLSANPPKESSEDDSLDVENEQLLEDSFVSDSEEVEIEGGSYLEFEPKYKQLLVIQYWKPEGGLKHALSTRIGKASCLNVSEGALEKAVSDYATKVTRFTQKHFVRVYPRGTRFTSSNYQPMVAWTHGAQMVALNMQGYDKALWSMHGMFRGNGGCGYVKKPYFMLQNETHLENNVFNPNTVMGVKTTLKVRVYMGDGWCRDISKFSNLNANSHPDFYIKLKIVGVPTDCDKKKTKVIDKNWVPIWNEDFSFNLAVPELALLRFGVREYKLLSKDEFGGQTCLPVSEINPGIRVVPLFDKKGDKLPKVKLLVKFEFVTSFGSD